jgi:hypothetical protein
MGGFATPNGIPNPSPERTVIAGVVVAAHSLVSAGQQETFGPRAAEQQMI